eukprot:1102840-Amphidinium_carterae.1
MSFTKPLSKDSNNGAMCFGAHLGVFAAKDTGKHTIADWAVDFEPGQEGKNQQVGCVIQLIAWRIL